MEWSLPASPPLSAACASPIADNATRSCHGRGLCQKNPLGEYWCMCNTLYAQLGACEQNFFELYQARDVSIPSIALIFLFAFFCLFVAEFAFDIKKFARRALRTPAFWGKIVMALFCAMRSVVISIWIYRSVSRTVEYATLEVVTRGIGTVSNGTVFCLTVIFWLEMLIQTEYMGKNVHIKRFRLATIILVSIIMPASLVLTVLTLVNSVSRLASLVTLSILTAQLIYVFVASIGFVHVTNRWLQEEQLKTVVNFLPETREQYRNIRYKSNIIMAELVAIGLTLAFFVFQLLTGTDIPLRYLVSTALSRYLDILHVVILFLFFESYTIRSRVLTRCGAKPLLSGHQRYVVSSEGYDSTVTTRHLSSVAPDNASRDDQAGVSTIDVFNSSVRSSMEVESRLPTIDSNDVTRNGSGQALGQPKMASKKRRDQSSSSSNIES